MKIFKNLILDCWNRGNRSIYCTKYSDTRIVMCNRDVITFNDNIFSINNTIISNIPDITDDEMLEFYISDLKSRNYKFL